MTEQDLNSFLEQLGLTEYEAKTLTSLFKLKEAEAPEISRNAQVPKTRVYVVLERLTNRGMIIEIYGRPKKYRVVEPNKVFDELLNEKKQELKKLEERANLLKGTIVEDAKEGATEKVMKVKDKGDFMRILGQEISGAKKSVHGFTSVSKEYSLLHDAMRKASSRDVEVKIISKIVAEQEHAKNYKEVGVELKQFDHGIHAYIIDGKKVIMALSDFDLDRPEYHFTIWPDNKPLSAALTHYFDSCWQKGKTV